MPPITRSSIDAHACDSAGSAKSKSVHRASESSMSSFWGVGRAAAGGKIVTKKKGGADEPGRTAGRVAAFRGGAGLAAVPYAEEPGDGPDGRGCRTGGNLPVDDAGGVRGGARGRGVQGAHRCRGGGCAAVPAAGRRSLPDRPGACGPGQADAKRREVPDEARDRVGVAGAGVGARHACAARLRERAADAGAGDGAGAGCTAAPNLARSPRCTGPTIGLVFPHDPRRRP